VYCEVDFRRLLAHDLGGRLAHLVLVPNPAHRAGGDFTLEDGRVGNGSGARYTYAGIAVMAPALVADVRPGEKAPLAPLLRAGAERGLISGELHRGAWQDVGTRERLAELEAHLASR
jgi:MurNAc alpha-1-phosphate uridylyltransferase